MSNRTTNGLPTIVGPEPVQGTSIATPTTVYIASPCQTPFGNMSLSASTKQWTAPELTKMIKHRHPLSTFVPEYRHCALILGWVLY